MNKQAELPIFNYSPSKLLLTSALVGAGGYGTLRLLKELARGIQEGQKDDEKKDREIVLDLPRPVVKTAEGEELSDIRNKALKLIAAGVGLPAGFLGASALYQVLKKKQKDEELALANQQYLEALKASQEKISNDLSTPLTDEFCSGVMQGMQGSIEDLVKTSETALPANWHNRSLMQMLGDTASGVYSDVNRATGGLPNIAIGSLGLLALLSGASVYASAKMREKEKSKEQDQPPQRMRIRYV